MIRNALALVGSVIVLGFAVFGAWSAYLVLLTQRLETEAKAYVFESITAIVADPSFGQLKSRAHPTVRRRFTPQLQADLEAFRASFLGAPAGALERLDCAHTLENEHPLNILFISRCTAQQPFEKAQGRLRIDVVKSGGEWGVTAFFLTFHLVTDDNAEAGHKIAAQSAPENPLYPHAQPATIRAFETAPSGALTPDFGYGVAIAAPYLEDGVEAPESD